MWSFPSAYSLNSLWFKIEIILRFLLSTSKFQFIQIFYDGSESNLFQNLFGMFHHGRRTHSSFQLWTFKVQVSEPFYHWHLLGNLLMWRIIFYWRSYYIKCLRWFLWWSLGSWSINFWFFITLKGIINIHWNIFFRSSSFSLNDFWFWWGLWYSCNYGLNFRLILYSFRSSSNSWIQCRFPTDNT